MIDVHIAGLYEQDDIYQILVLGLARDITNSLVWKINKKRSSPITADPKKLDGFIDQIKKEGSYYWMGSFNKDVDFDGMPYEKHPVLGPIEDAYQDTPVYLMCPISNSLGKEGKLGVFKLVRFRDGQFPHDVAGLVDGRLYWVRQARFFSRGDAERQYPTATYNQLSFSSHVHEYPSGVALHDRLDSH